MKSRIAATLLLALSLGTSAALAKGTTQNTNTSPTTNTSGGGMMKHSKHRKHRKHHRKHRAAKKAATTNSNTR